MARAILLLALSIAAGCRLWTGGPLQSAHDDAPLANPMFVPVVDREFFWCRLVDIVDDDYVIDREERVHQIGDVLTEGRIETLPRIGSTLFEPHLSDSASHYQKWLATLQTIRRRASVRVIPQSAGYLVEVMVIIEQEDLPRPEMSSAGSATFRNDGTIERDVSVGPAPRGVAKWYQICRDFDSEQRILAKLRECFPVPAGPLVSPVHKPTPEIVMPLPESLPPP
jgi:hypothetical protein